MNATTRPDCLVGEWADTLTPGGDQYTDLNTALCQHALIGDHGRAGVDRQMAPLALLDSVNCLRHWQTTSAAPRDVRDAMGVLADDIRAWAGRMYNADLVDEVERLKREVAETAAASMRERAAQLAETPGEWSRLETPADRIRALPLTPDSDDTEVRHITDPEAYIDAVADALASQSFDITNQWAYTDGTYGTDENPEAWEGGIRIGDLTLAWNERDGWTLVGVAAVHDLADIDAPADKVVAAAKKYLPNLVTKKASELAVGDIIHDGEALVVTAPPVDLLDGSVSVLIRDSYDEDDRVTLDPDAAVKVSS